MIRRTIILLAVLLAGCVFLKGDGGTNRILNADVISNSLLKETGTIPASCVDGSFYDQLIFPTDAKQIKEDKERIATLNPIFKGQVEVIQVVDNNGVVLASKVVK